MTRSKDAMEQLIPALHENFVYDPKTGVFLWKKGGRSGRPAFQQNNNGYLRGQIAGCALPAHRAAWLMHHGEWPDRDLDHIDGNRQNNAIANLRVVDFVDNQRNRKTPVTNNTGVMGVAWRAERQSWRAQIGIDGRNIYLGHFESKALAIVARKAAEKALGYHKNHGRSA